MNIKKYIFGSKGVGSQGDGTVQFLAKDADNQGKLVEYLKEVKKMPAYPLTLKASNEASSRSPFSGDIYIFGAKSVAIGVIRAIRECFTDSKIKGCVVSTLVGNPKEVEGLDVEELKEFAGRLSTEERKAVKILVATPIYVQGEICDTLKVFGFENVICLDSGMEEDLMRAFYKKKNIFTSLKDIMLSSDDPIKANILAVCHNADRRLKFHYENDPWVRNIQVGASLTDIKLYDLNDMTGDNISDKNPLYCELTGLYWMWKNMIQKGNTEEYYGLYQYRRVLDIDKDDLRRIAASDIDAVLPFPMIHVPDIREHHGRYIDEAEWELLLEVVKEYSPNYMENYDSIFGKEYLYNYNIFFAKGKVVDDLCSWMFSILFQFENMCKNRGIVLGNRHISYIGESMITWFFMSNAEKLKLVHTGRILRI